MDGWGREMLQSGQEQRRRAMRTQWIRESRLAKARLDYLEERAPQLLEQMLENNSLEADLKSMVSMAERAQEKGEQRGLYESEALELALAVVAPAEALEWERKGEDRPELSPVGRGMLEKWKREQGM